MRAVEAAVGGYHQQTTHGRRPTCTHSHSYVVRTMVLWYYGTDYLDYVVARRTRAHPPSFVIHRP